MTVFMDTFALIAWINTRDGAHQRVKAYLDSYSGSIATTEWVLLEFADAFSLSSSKPLQSRRSNAFVACQCFWSSGLTRLLTRLASTFTRPEPTKTGL